MARGAALLAIHLVAAGAELGTYYRKLPFDPTRGFVLTDVTWHPPFGSATRAHATVYWAPVTHHRATGLAITKVPINIERRSTGELGADPRCAHDALLRAYNIRTQEVPAASASTTAFFTFPEGKTFMPQYIKSIANDIATALELRTQTIGGASAFRIGGALDLIDAHGDDEARRIICTRGRWGSDIAWLFFHRYEWFHHPTAAEPPREATA
jgi:hypothetical protein